MQEPTSAVVDAVVTWLDGLLTGIRVVKGWPTGDLDLETGPILSVTKVRAKRTDCAAWTNVVEVEDVTATTLWRTAWLRVSLQLDLWCAYEAQRDDLAEQVWDALSGDPIAAPVTVLTSAYHDRRVQILPGQGDAPETSVDDDDTGITRGEFRMTWPVSAETDLVKLTIGPAQMERELMTETETAGETASDTTTL
jgi:hypothetical protein